MNIGEYILNEIKPLHLNNSIEEAKQLFDQFPFTHYPVVDNGKLLGSFAEDDVHTSDKSEEELLNYYHFLHLSLQFFSFEKRYFYFIHYSSTSVPKVLSYAFMACSLVKRIIIA